jgi:hypothetical protein
MKTNTVQKKETIGGDLKDFINSTIRDTAKNHLEAWKTRYAAYTKVSQVRFDLFVNHDDSLEIEYTEQELGRKLNDLEINYLADKFHKKVVELCKSYIN